MSKIIGLKAKFTFGFFEMFDYFEIAYIDQLTCESFISKGEHVFETSPKIQSEYAHTGRFNLYTVRIHNMESVTSVTLLR